MTKKIFLLFLSFSIATSLFGCSSDEGTTAETEESLVSKVVSEDPIGYDYAYLSVDLFRFSIKIDGNTYKLPALQPAFIKNGWTISGNEETIVKSLFTEKASLSKGNVRFDIEVINPTKKDLPFEECPIGKLCFDFTTGFSQPEEESSNSSNEEKSFEIYLADDFLLNGATKKTITEKYGDPDSTENYGDYSIITYGSRKTTGNYATYFFKFNKNGSLKSFNMSNYYIQKY